MTGRTRVWEGLDTTNNFDFTTDLQIRVTGGVDAKADLEARKGTELRGWVGFVR